MKRTAVKTVGILTSGGDAPGLNAAIRALCVTGKNKYGMKCIGVRNGYRGLIDNDTFKPNEINYVPTYIPKNDTNKTNETITDNIEDTIENWTESIDEWDDDNEEEENYE